MERQLNAGQLQQHSLPWAAAAPPATEPPAINPATRGAGGKKAAASRPPVMYSMGVGTWPPSCACSRQAGRQAPRGNALSALQSSSIMHSWQRGAALGKQQAAHHEGCDGCAHDSGHNANVIKRLLQGGRSKPRARGRKISPGLLLTHCSRLPLGGIDA